ncbi:MAG: SsrA-binding protein SmpB [bacterium]|nr:SsrA-binding protein SmpB [bacterium]
MSKKEPESKGDAPIKVLSENRKARFNYHIIDTYEAGIVLTGYEIKSIRNGGANIAEAYIRVQEGEVFLIGAHFKPYAFTKQIEVDPVRPRKLLLNKSEIIKLQGKVSQKGNTIVPLELYLKGGRAKLKIALAKGKNAPDKRHAIKDREVKREMAKVLKNNR